MNTTTNPNRLTTPVVALTTTEIAFERIAERAAGETNDLDPVYTSSVKVLARRLGKDWTCKAPSKKVRRQARTGYFIRSGMVPSKAE